MKLSPLIISPFVSTTLTSALAILSAAEQRIGAVVQNAVGVTVNEILASNETTFKINEDVKSQLAGNPDVTIDLSAATIGLAPVDPTTGKVEPPFDANFPTIELYTTDAIINDRRKMNCYAFYNGQECGACSICTIPYADKLNLEKHQVTFDCKGLVPEFSDTCAGTFVPAIDGISSAECNTDGATQQDELCFPEPPVEMTNSTNVTATGDNSTVPLGENAKTSGSHGFHGSDAMVLTSVTALMGIAISSWLW